MKLGICILIALSVTCFVPIVWSGGQKRAEQMITITYWTHEDPNRTPFELDLAAQFMKVYPHVNIQRITYPSTRVAERLFAAFGANQGPDIFHTQLEDSYWFITSGNTAPVSVEAMEATTIPEIVDRYIKGSLDPVYINGQLYGIPMEILNWCLYINDRMFREVGLDPETDYPKTWEDIVRISELMVRYDGNTIIRRGFDFRYSDYLIALVPMVEQLGGKLISDDGKIAIVGQEAWITFLKFMQQWGPAGKNLGSPKYQYARFLFNFDNDEVAMALTGMYQQARIRADNPEFYFSGHWRVVPFPTFEHAVEEVAASHYCQYMMVNAHSDQQTQYYAWKFINFLQQHSEQYLAIRIIQPSKTLMESQLYQKVPYAEVFKHDMERARVVYHAKHSSTLQDLIKQAVESVMFENVTPERAYASLKAHAQELLDSD